ncbi:MAG: hypothetical protein ABSC93_21740 [Bryobacteraceae bacterium]|jgi:hypothetical protein
MKTTKYLWNQKGLPRQGRIAAGAVMTLLIVATASAQNQPSDAAAPVHPIPTAPKKSYTPASVHALPGLECRIYPTGSASSTGVTAFTDDDGYARFHAVRAAAGDKVQRLTLDCTDSDGNFSSYSADLTSDDTFEPRPLNLANERGADRPALKGDPLSYTQSDLIQAGYGLRPDPKDAAAYSRWLRAASSAGRFLEIKRPQARPQIRPSKTGEAPPWTGSVMTGAPKYLSTEANFNVPTGIPSGDETTGTEIAIWNGLGGYTTGSGLIQGGVNLETTPTVALYGSWREYCCGDGDSNGYGGAFVPNPGDQIYSQEWYCDKNGNISQGGGYGCTFLQDVTSGAILNCVSPTGSPCWSVKALPTCVKNPAYPNCMTLGDAAEFVIENQTPQCCSPATAFSDFTPTVDMYGSAYSSKTGSYSQTVSTDPKVTTLVDFTATTSHMSVSLGTTDQTYFTMSQFAKIGGTAQSNFIPCPEAPYYCNPQSIAVGPNANGSTVGDPWVLGTAKTSAGDYYVYQWRNGSWVRASIGAGTQIAVSPQGYAWVITHTGAIYYWNGTTFVLAPGGGCATSIGVGPNAYGSQYGDPWVIGCNGSDIADGSIYQLQGSAWVQQPGAADQIAVSPAGVPWVITSSGSVFYWNGSYFTGAPAGCATSIGVGPTTAPLAGPYGDVWITGCGDATDEGSNIFQLQKGTAWVQIPGVASQISVSPDLGVPWLVTLTGEIFE